MDLDLRLVVNALQWFFILYFIGLHGAYLLLNVISFFGIYRYLQLRDLEIMEEGYSGFNPPVTIIVPAFNEDKTIAASVQSILQLNYSEYEVIVVNDGSTDKTIEVLRSAFSLVPFPEVYPIHLATEEVKVIYRSKDHPNLKVIDKDNGGKADALNAGINISKYPIFCGIDADSILQRDSLFKAVQPFLEDSRVIASGGTIRIANGCRVEDGFLVDVDLPKNPLALIQITEYLRAFLFGRLGWSPLNALLIISGAFGLFKKEAVISAGGYLRETVGEDMELIVRLHRKFRKEGKPYRITFVPDPICWTEAPEDLGTIRRQRSRWQRGLSESLFSNLGLLFNLRGGIVGRIAFPFFLVFEWFGPVVELAGYIIMTLAFIFGLLSLQAFITFLMLSVGFGLLISASALFLEMKSFHIYNKPNHFFRLIMAAFMENFGYRQLNTFWRLEGLFKWLFNKEKSWGDMKRKGAWSSANK
jgi:cellulose synthase/poly-beta-1,6-N-acetylglucosamine synthase-like glycosyltransferase